MQRWRNEFKEKVGLGHHNNKDGGGSIVLAFLREADALAATTPIFPKIKLLSGDTLPARRCKKKLKSEGL